jgi:rhodanese-related sulfurtransferase
MLNNEVDARTYKNAVYGAFAQVAKAMASPRRLELLDLLVQGPLTVEGLARGTGQPVPSASQHLQVLKRARLVERRGTHIVYRLASEVGPVFVSLRRLAEARSPELQAARRDFYARAEAAEVIEAGVLRGLLEEGGVTLLDVRPSREFAHAHIPGARSIPIDQLAGRLDELPRDQLVVATCRGPYCVFAAEAVRLLRGSGRSAVRFEQGVAEWQLDGGRLSSSPS